MTSSNLVEFDVGVEVEVGVEVQGSGLALLVAMFNTFTGGWVVWRSQE